MPSLRSRLGDASTTIRVTVRLLWRMFIEKGLAATAADAASVDARNSAALRARSLVDPFIPVHKSR